MVFPAQETWKTAGYLLESRIFQTRDSRYFIWNHITCSSSILLWINAFCLSLKLKHVYQVFLLSSTLLSKFFFIWIYMYVAWYFILFNVQIIFSLWSAFKMILEASHLHTPVSAPVIQYFILNSSLLFKCFIWSLAPGLDLLSQRFSGGCT